MSSKPADGNATQKVEMSKTGDAGNTLGWAVPLFAIGAAIVFGDIVDLNMLSGAPATNKSFEYAYLMNACIHFSGAHVSFAPKEGLVE